jgi:hypothetical protein
MNRPWQPVFVNALTTVSLNHGLSYSSLFSFMDVSMESLLFMKADITLCFVHVCDDGKFCFAKASVQRKQEEGKHSINILVQASVALEI